MNYNNVISKINHSVITQDKCVIAFNSKIMVKVINSEIEVAIVNSYKP